jgi:hypothetical protein
LEAAGHVVCSEHKAKLNEMAAAGLIERKRIVRGHHGTNLYFRSRA